jgi:hypothetical protein
MKKSDLITTIPIRDKNGNVVGEKEVVRYAGLLARAHEEGLKRVTTKLIQAPHRDNGNMAIVHATVETRKGIFEGIGDATPANVSSFVAQHLIRMAETRGKARAMKDATDIGNVCLDELVADLMEESVMEEKSRQEPSGGNGGNGDRQVASPMTSAQRRFLFRLLAQKGIEGDKARESLLKAFEVEDLAQVTKREASRMIDLIQQGGAENLFVAEA